MLIRDGASRTASLDRRLALLLAGVAGAINAFAFRLFGAFPANMTGNVSLFSDRLASRDVGAALLSLSVLALFVLGAACGALLVDAGRRRGFRRIYAACVLLEAASLLGVGVGVGVGAGLRAGIGREAFPPAATVGALAVIMGFQNAISTRISGARVRTTHLTGLATDLGLALGAGDRARARLPLLTIAAFASGGIVGVLLGPPVLFAAAAALGAASLAALLGAMPE